MSAAAQKCVLIRNKKSTKLNTFLKSLETNTEMLQLKKLKVGIGQADLPFCHDCEGIPLPLKHECDSL